MKNLTVLALATASLSLFSTCPPALAGRNDLDKPLPTHDNMMGDGPHVHQYDEIVSPDMETAWTYIHRARSALKNGNVSRAMALATKAVKMDDDDIDTHQILAQSMQAKLERQTDKDPDLFRKCVHEWILIYRNEVGMEKGMTWKGLSLGGTYYNDDEHGTLAKKQLVKLTGYSPKLWETDNHFENRVTRTVETAVSAKVKREDSEKGKYE